MKIVDIVAAVLLVVGGLNWGLVALMDFDLVAFIFGNIHEFKRIFFVRSHGFYICCCFEIMIIFWQ